MNEQHITKKTYKRPKLTNKKNHENNLTTKCHLFTTHIKHDKTQVHDFQGRHVLRRSTTKTYCFTTSQRDFMFETPKMISVSESLQYCNNMKLASRNMLLCRLHSKSFVTTLPCLSILNSDIVTDTVPANDPWNQW